jgi:hypothetical protein
MSTSHTLKDTYVTKYFTVHFNKINQFHTKKGLFSIGNNAEKVAGNVRIKPRSDQTIIQECPKVAQNPTAKCPTKSPYANHTTYPLKHFYEFLT